MRKILALTLILGTAVLMGGLADASGGHADDPTSTITKGVRYDWWGNEGELSLVAEPGATYTVFDHIGNPLAAGVMASNFESFPAGNSGVGPDGVIVFVVMEGNVYSVTDPDWEWN